MNEKIIKALRKIGIEKLNELQKEAYSKIKSKRNCLIIAPTGSGKTEAALIPAIEEIYENKLQGVALIYITPLRALNRDLLRRIKKLAEELSVSIAVRHGDTEKGERAKQSLKPPQILITTPETFQILFLGKNLRKSLRNVRFLIIDEVHELIDSKRGVQLSVAIERLRELASFQIIALSATVSDKKIVMDFFRCDDVVELKTVKRYEVEVVCPEVKEEDVRLAKALNVSERFASELRLIKEIVEEHNSTLIFVNTRQMAEALALKLKKLTSVEVHHGSLSKEVRIENERKFVNGEIKALICTSSLELGIDIGSVDCVIQYGSPREIGRLLQRVGRSGHRLERVSKGVIIANSFDDILESIVIVKKAERGEIEATIVHEKCIDVLANQIAAISLEYKSIEVSKAYQIVKRTYPFRNLDYAEFLRLCEYFDEIGIIRMRDGKISAIRKTRRYFYENISMIVDERHYLVRDIATNKIIGVLDESFLQTFENEVFAMKGEAWRIVSIDDFVNVVPESFEAAVPSWIGEEIPVQFDVAIDVGKLRGIIAELTKRDEKLAINYLLENFKINKKAAEIVVDVIRDHVKRFLVPTDRRIVVEEKDGVSIINACFGHRVNEGIGRVLALLISAKTGRNVAVEIDPYRIKLTPAENTAEILASLPAEIEKLLEIALVDTKLFQWKFVNAARKIGYLSKDIETNRINIRALIQKLKDTPIYEEAIREIITEKIDIKNLKNVLREKKFEVITYNDFTPIGISSQRMRSDMLLTLNPTEVFLEKFKERIENEECYLVCLNCGCSIKLQVKMINELSCLKCGSKMIACVNARRNLNDVSKNELFKLANLVSMHGMKAVYALNTYGVGAENASRILRNYYPDEKAFLKALLEMEKNYIRTRIFWD